jgi:UDP-N-acetylglucosamine acyltransferase
MPVADRVTIANGALLAGFVTLGEGVFVSGNVAVHQFVRVGPFTMQARVTRDVPPCVIVAGNSEICGLNVVGMRRAGMSSDQRDNARRAYAVVYRSRLNVSQAVERLRTLSPNEQAGLWLAFIEASTRGLCPARRRGTRER